MVAEGEIAPDFEAPNQDGTSFKLSSLRGTPVVLYFYPKADTPGCTIEAKGFRDQFANLEAKKVHVVGVSTDDCPEQKAFAQKYSLPFTLIADKSQDVARKYGVLADSGHARRVSFFLDGNGKVLEVVNGSPDHHVDRARARFLQG
jgi:thioredoxin-dependent peroxiredoxin